MDLGCKFEESTESQQAGSPGLPDLRVGLKAERRLTRQRVSVTIGSTSMKIGILADIHDNVDNVRHAINMLNGMQVEVVLIAGDFVSPLVVPSLRKLHGKVIACLGDNDGNQIGIAGGMKIVGTLAHGPVCYRTDDGLHILMSHQLTEIRDCIDGADVIVFAHSHRPSIATDRHGRLFINPGEVSGWMFRKPSVALLDTTTKGAKILELPGMNEPVCIDG